MQLKTIAATGFAVTSLFVVPMQAAEIDAVNERLEGLRTLYPQVDALTELHGIALYSAMVVIGEFGDVTRFRRAKQVAA